MKLCFLILLFLFSKNTLYAKLPRIYTQNLIVEKSTTLNRILRVDLKLPKELLDGQEYIDKIKMWNQRINSNLDFKRLIKGDQIYLEVPFKYKSLLKKKMAARKRLIDRKKKKLTKRFTKKKYKKKIITKKNKRTKKKRNKRKIASKNKTQKKIRTRKKTKLPPKVDLSVFYAVSQGQFQETIKSSNISAETTQDSPVTIGVSFKREHPNDQHMFYSGSFYLSYLNGGNSTISNKEVDIPFEYGSNFYWNFKTRGNYTYYAGVDHERFSTFNIDELTSGLDLETREHTLSYLTVGYTNLYNLYSKTIFVKASLSQSIISQTNVQSTVSDESYNGNKFILFLATPIYPSISLTSFYKQHFLDGPTELSISRFGLGFSYKF
jgi:hypothetical protein